MYSDAHGNENMQVDLQLLLSLKNLFSIHSRVFCIDAEKLIKLSSIHFDSI